MVRERCYARSVVEIKPDRPGWKPQAGGAREAARGCREAVGPPQDDAAKRARFARRGGTAELLMENLKFLLKYS